MVQRVSQAEVRVDGEVVGSIGKGLCVLLGVGPDDTEQTAQHLAERVATLRIFGDGNGKMNLDLGAAGGAALVVSQFTLYADTSRGHRPSFTSAAPPQLGEQLCDVFASALRERGHEVATGRFAARMKVDIVNDGPVTIVVTSAEDPWQADAG